MSSKLERLREVEALLITSFSVALTEFKRSMSTDSKMGINILKEARELLKEYGITSVDDEGSSLSLLSKNVEDMEDFLNDESLEESLCGT